jgi:hypothetical protein
MTSFENSRKKHIMGVISFNRASVPKRYIKRMGGHGWLIESCLLGTDS